MIMSRSGYSNNDEISIYMDWRGDFIASREFYILIEQNVIDRRTMFNLRVNMGSI